jgi:hypothetical protein
MKTWIRVCTWTGYSTAIGSVTLTPLLGFVVGDKRPSAVATALQLLFAVLWMLVAVALTIIDKRRRRLAGPVSRPLDRFAAGRKQAHDAGLPWVEADGTVSWSDKPRRQGRRDSATSPPGGSDV